VPTRLDELKPDPKNRRTHGPRNVEMIASSLRDVGAARSIVIDEDDIILAGNGVTEAARAAGIDRVRIIDTDGDEIIAVRRRNLTDDQKRALAMYDNRTAELAEWNAPQLDADVAAGLVLQPWFTEDEVAAMHAANLGVAMDYTPETSALKGLRTFGVVCTPEQWTRITEIVKAAIAAGHGAGDAALPQANALVWVLEQWAH